MNDHQTNGNGAHTNGNGHTKIFDLAPKQDPMLAIVVPGARKRVAVMHRLSFGARNFFQWLTDQSLTPGSNITKGVLKISDHDAGVRFKVHSKTIRNWKRELEDTGEIWLTEKWMKNSFPQTVYNITAIVGQATLPLNAHGNDGSLVEDEVFSSNRRRQQSARRDPGTGSFVCRVHGKSGCDICRHRTPPRVYEPEVAPEISQKQAETDTAGIFLPPTTAPDCRPPRQNGAAHHGNAVPSPTAPICRPARQPGAVADGKTVPQWAAPHCRGERKQGADNGKTLGIESGSQRGNGGEPTPRNELEEAAFKEGDTGFGDWCDSWKLRTEANPNGEYRGKLVKELSRCRVKLQLSPAPFWQRRADFLQMQLDGGKPPKPAKVNLRQTRTTTATTTPPKMDLAKARELMQAAKAKEPALA